MPATGNQPSLSENSSISRMPSQKLGVVSVNRNAMRMTWSTQRPWLTAASTPNVTVMMAASAIA